MSVVIPALNEEGTVAAAARSARRAGADEVVVVDGGSADGTAAAARGEADLVVTAPRGRARQMNAGARAARGAVLLFLHADTVAPPGAVDAVREALRDGRCVGGAFRVRLAVSPRASATARALLALTGRMIGVRSLLLRVYTGDQGIFARRDAFEAAGGFPDVPLMEDVRFSRRLSRLGRTALLGPRLSTSARRWESRGVVRTILLMWAMRIAHRLGMPPSACARIYAGRSSLTPPRSGGGAKAG